MAFKPASGIKLLFKKGDGADPEVFAIYCSILAKSISFDGTEATFDIPDCTDLEAVNWVVSEMQSKRVTLVGSGMLNTPDFDKFYEWWDSGETSNCQLVLDVPAADGGRILQGGFKLPKFQLTGNKGEKCQVSISVASDGPVTKVNNA
jgi:hypothetical protein